MSFAFVVIKALEERTESSTAETSLETPPVGATADSLTESTGEEHAGADDGTEQQEEQAQDDEQKAAGAEGEVNEAASGAASPEIDPEDIEVKVCNSMPGKMSQMCLRYKLYPHVYKYLHRRVVHYC